VFVRADPVRGELRERLLVIPPVTLEFPRPLVLLAPGATRPVEVELTAARPGLAGELRLAAPPGWLVSPAAQPWSLAAIGDRARVSFQLTAPSTAATVELGASARVGEATYPRRRIEILHDHIPRQVLHPRARLTAV